MEFVATPDKSFLKLLPHEPGVYRFYQIKVDTQEEELLYVGKAINLSKRIKSYFQKTSALSPRISLMVAKIDKIIVTVTENEASALLLENNLIKSQKPKYNIVFRDDKSYPLIRLSKHDYPKIDSYRGKGYDDNYFGPYPNATTVSQALDTIQSIFKLRTCSDNFFNSRQKPCMLYQIKRCSAPCMGYITVEEYQEQVFFTKQFLRGNYKTVLQLLMEKMNELSDNQEFELAALIRDKVSIFSQINNRQIVVNYNQKITADVIALMVIPNQDKYRVFIYIINIKNGVYNSDNHFKFDSEDSDVENVLEAFLSGYYLEHKNISLVYVEPKLNVEFSKMFFAATKIKIIISHSDWIKKIYKMAYANLNKIINQAEFGLEKNFIKSAQILSDLLGIGKINRIECIDISHNNGVNAVASLVVYENEKIDPAKYRLYNLSDEVGGDDLLGIKEMLTRRLRSDTLPYPEVILVDGGINQYKTVKKLVEENDLCDKMRVISIYKGTKRDPRYDKLILREGLILNVSDNKDLFCLLQNLRDEAHRFAITRHRKKQIKSMSMSKLTEIEGLGSVKRKALMAHFGSVRGVMNANINELQEVYGIGESLANQIYTYFRS